MTGSFGPRQVDHEQFALAYSRCCPGRLAHRHAEQRMASGGCLVHSCWFYRSLPVTLVQ